MSKHQEPHRSIAQDQDDQVRRTAGATLAALGTTHSNPASRDKAAAELTATLAGVFPAYGMDEHRKAGRKMAEDMGNTISQCKAVNRGRLGWALVWTDGTASYMPNEATARAHAATPDLYAACEAAIPALIHLGDFVGNEFAGAVGLDPYDRCAIIGSIRAALAAARGE